MRISTLFLVVFLALTARASDENAYSKMVEHAIAQLRFHPTPGLPPQIGGEAVGYAGTPHPTYLLFQYIRATAQDSDIEAMLTDHDPVVRSIGALCALHDDWRKIQRSKIDSLLDDRSPISVGEGGCSFYVSSVGELVAKLKADPKLFEWPQNE